jgi:LysM domain
VKRIVLIGIIGLVALGLALIFNQELNDDPSEKLSAAVSAKPVAPPESTTPPAAPMVASGERGRPASEPLRPTFDIVRVNRDGDAVIAGQAAPHAVVTVRDGQRVVGEVTADPRGEWVLLPAVAQPPGDRELSLTARLVTGEVVESETVVVLSVPERDARGRDGALVVAMPRDRAGPSRILQSRDGGDAGPLPDPASAAIAAEGRLRLSVDTIDYDSQGKVALRGHATPGATIEIDAGERRVGTAKADRRGNWVLSSADELPAGQHNLTVRERLADGRPGARLAMPFYRAESKDVPEGAMIVVQPGNSLWRIARRSYGAGVHFTEIYEANRAQIRDPDLIYPGQVITLPGRVN